MNMSNKYITANSLLLLGVVLVIVGIYNLTTGNLFGGEGGQGAASCDIISNANVAIGDDSSVEIVAGHAQNAYVVVTQPINATNTVSLAFGEDAVAGATGYKLGSSTAEYHPNTLVFGLNSDFPYTGSIEAITNIGSSTIGVTICRY